MDTETHKAGGYRYNPCLEAEVHMMEILSQIHAFAVKWIQKFEDKNTNYLELVDHYMADECAALGFEMDCGDAFSEKYGNAATDCTELKRIIDEVTDIALLGSAIYSQWRYFNHWAYSGEEILAPANSEWFITALRRMAELSARSTLFTGTPQKIRIISNNWCYGPMPEPEDEIEQHLTINSNGRVWFSVYAFGEIGKKHPRVRSTNYRIDPQKAKKVLDAIADYFSEPYEEIFATDIGDWKLLIANTDGQEFQYKGSLCADLVVEDTDLSELIRDTLGMDDLYAFDGNNKPDVIKRITVDYHRVTKITPKHIPEGVTWNHVTWDYKEQLIIDRKSETLEHVQQIGTGCKVTRKFEIEEGIDSLLENFDVESLFSHIEGNPEDVVDSPNETRDYTITIEFRKKPTRVISGSFDKKGLPDDFAFFAEEVYTFIKFYGIGEILDSTIYQKAKRRREDYIFCSVEFDGGYKSYYYLTDDDSIEIGDYVVVPAGRDNHEAIVEVVDIEYFTDEDAPFPIEKTKHILRKYTDEDLVPPEDADAETIWCPVANRDLTEIDCIEICDVANHMLKEDVLNSFSPPIEWDEEKRTQCRCCPYHIGE